MARVCSLIQRLNGHILEDTLEAGLWIHDGLGKVNDLVPSSSLLCSSVPAIIIMTMVIVMLVVMIRGRILLIMVMMLRIIIMMVGVSILIVMVVVAQ